MTEQNKENLSQTLVDRESYKTTVANFKKTIADLQSDNVILLDDVANKDSELLTTKRELDSEKARRVRAENLLNEELNQFLNQYPFVKFA
ncbi:hypothetical protein BGZ65_002778 [Modicella reniformis]|uniref:Uncharacterized protein n=1 Tax=Modicella reniformis TaxID=1440133 RepID=A0A9P6LUA9_9FUNG|nr:hypothetical protein BGZ65_002778 [Modicella reniformis]